MTQARILAGRLADLLRREQAAMAEFLIALADFDRRRAWVDLGHSSLFYFLHRELGLSKGAAHYRKTAAELVQRFPEVVEPLRDGRLCITSIVHLAKVLTPENRQEMLPKFFQRSKREAKAVATALQPATAVPYRDVLTTVRPSCTAGSVQPVEPTCAQPTNGQTPPPMTADVAATLLLEPIRRASAEPLSKELSRLHITVSREFLDKLEAARAALSHSRPRATAEGILEAGLDLVLEQHARRKGLVDKPRKQSRPSAEPHIPAAVKREVWIRDRGCCQWPLESGGSCGSTSCVEFDHEVPRAWGGASTVENVRLLCRFHNDLAARRLFGNDWMDQFTPKRSRDGLAKPIQGTAPG